MQTQMLAPAAALVAWSLVVLAWMTVTRFAAASEKGLDLKQSKPGGRGQDLEGVLPDVVNWKAHNFTHLMEQPTLFYAVVIIIALSGPTAADALVAWGYVALRIVHSVWQATVNRIPVRLLLFAAATVCLVYLAWRACALTIFA